jgi:hypothetical protein
MVMSTLHSAITVPPIISAVDRDRVLRIALFATWCVATLWMASHHVFWRDEVRALSIALAGEDTFAMLRGLQGEGHPALWYLLLRGGYALAGRPEVMPALAWLIGAAAMALFIWRAPFRLGTKALVLFGFYGICELVVSPRNYGIGMLILFAIAATYPRCRDRGVIVGLLIALLCNTSVTATLLAAALMVFWAIELLCEEGWHWTRKHNIFLINCGVVLIGAILCFITVYPPAHDAVMQKPPTDGLAWTILEQLSRPDRTFHALGFSVMGDGPFATGVINVLLIGALVSLIRHPAAFLAALFACCRCSCSTGSSILAAIGTRRCFWSLSSPCTGSCAKAGAINGAARGAALDAGWSRWRDSATLFFRSSSGSRSRSRSIGRAG